MLVLHDEDAYSSFEALPGMVERHPNWRAERIAPTRGCRISRSWGGRRRRWDRVLWERWREA
ncbi:MAG: hypothetical protein U0232_17575 [Thermomicrobiales bacterium]